MFVCRRQRMTSSILFYTRRSHSTMVRGDSTKTTRCDGSRMLAYLFWHVPLAEVEKSDYEAALIDFHRHLAHDPPQGFECSTTYRISSVPWLNNRTGYEDWCFLEFPSALDALNKAAVKPERWDVHAGVSYKTEFGHGGLYYHLIGETLPLDGSKVVWLKRPRRIRYESPLREIIDSSRGFLSCWRKLMVLGPADEFAVVGDATLEIWVPPGWQAIAVNRQRLLDPEE